MELIGGACFTSGFGVDEFAQVACIGLMEEIVCDRQQLELNALLNLEHIERMQILVCTVQELSVVFECFEVCVTARINAF